MRRHPEQKPTVLLFDWDNTLVDGWAGISAALNAAFVAFDKPLWTVEDTKNRVRVALKETDLAVFGWVRVRVLLPFLVVTGALDQVVPPL